MTAGSIKEYGSFNKWSKDVGQLRKPIKKGKFTSFHEYEKRIDKETWFVYLSQVSKALKPHFFRDRKTANKQAKKIKEAGRKAKVRSYQKSYVIYFR